MKYFNLFAVSSILFFLTSCSSQFVNINNRKQIDKRLVGTWIGSEKDQQIDGVEKNWVMIRNEDGTFILDFTFKQDGEIHNLNENGNWWIENGKFYEFHMESGKTDLYKYNVLNKNQIKFTSESISVEMNSDNYTFTDTRKNSKLKDGLSFENAVKVNSVREEYEFIKSNCSGCEVTSQSLTDYKGNKFDVIKVKKPDGSTGAYYFDIKSFFGKF